jgi:hypothetical protein
MKTMIFALLLALCAPAWAEWKALSTDDDGTDYIDTEAIRRDGDLVKIWLLVNFRKQEMRQGKTFFSTKLEMEIDCKQLRMRSLSAVGYKYAMGRGEAVALDAGSRQWVALAPDVEAGKVACAAK